MDEEQFETMSEQTNTEAPEWIDDVLTEIRQNTAAVNRLHDDLCSVIPLLCILVVFAFYGLIRRGIRKAVLTGVR